MIQLTVQDSDLYVGDRLLLVRYEEGDCDTISWPFLEKKDEENLEAALFDAREIGSVPADTQTVLLPDGSSFSF